MRSEAELVGVKIERAETWLALQKELMKRRHFHRSPLYSAAMEDLNKMLETKVLTLHVRQRALSQRPSTADE